MSIRVPTLVCYAGRTKYVPSATWMTVVPFSPPLICLKASSASFSDLNAVAGVVPSPPVDRESTK